MNHNSYNPDYKKQAFGEKGGAEYPFQSEGILPPGLKGKITNIAQSGDQKIIEVLIQKLAKGGIIPGYAKGTDKVDKPKLKVINPAGVSRYLGIVKNIKDNKLGGLIKQMGMTPNQEKYLWRQFMDNPENADIYLSKFLTRSAIPIAAGPGRGIGKINYDVVKEMAKEKGVKFDPKNIGQTMSLPEKIGVRYRPSDKQLLKDLVNVLLPNAQGQSEQEIQRLNQLRKLVKPYEKDPSKMPGGIRAALEDMFAIHRSSNPNQKAVPASKVENQFNMIGSGPLEGPGLYTSSTLKISDQSWNDYAGDNLYRQSYSEEAWNELLKSKGYADDATIISEIQKNPKLLEEYGYTVDRETKTISLEGLKVSDKLIQHLIKQGYVGYYGGQTVKTNWRIGEKGFGLEPFTPNMNSVLGYAKGGIIPGYANGGFIATQKPKASVFDIDDTLLDLSSFMPAHEAKNEKLPKDQRTKWHEEAAKNPKGIPAAIERLRAAQARGNKILLMTAR
ncbi:MAG: hypothetical protein EB127_18505, partial [Alphaproteobacteria bacterium]|nr:hypothetical protein [Alphaproteobacteria bacterium]